MYGISFKVTSTMEGTSWEKKKKSLGQLCLVKMIISQLTIPWLLKQSGQSGDMFNLWSSDMNWLVPDFCPSLLNFFYSLQCFELFFSNLYCFFFVCFFNLKNKSWLTTKHACFIITIKCWKILVKKKSISEGMNWPCKVKRNRRIFKVILA